MVDNVQARRRGRGDLPGVRAYGSAAVGAGSRRHDARRGVHLRVALVRLVHAYRGRGVELASRRRGQPHEPHAALTRLRSAIVGVSLLMLGLVLFIFIIAHSTGRTPDIEKIKRETLDHQQPQPQADPTPR